MLHSKQNKIKQNQNELIVIRRCTCSEDVSIVNILIKLLVSLEMCAKTVVFSRYDAQAQWIAGDDDGAHIKIRCQTHVLCCCSCIKLYNIHENVVQKQSMIWDTWARYYMQECNAIFFFLSFIVQQTESRKNAAYSSLLFNTLSGEEGKKEEKKTIQILSSSSASIDSLDGSH